MQLIREIFELLSFSIYVQIFFIRNEYISKFCCYTLIVDNNHALRYDRYCTDDVNVLMCFVEIK